ncbi:hypothetical protein THIX_10075 [Thiomonas sp. X19]|nr:hypothetical protein THIX_10075 [Thiomonas sp. X19]
MRGGVECVGGGVDAVDREPVLCLGSQGPNDAEAKVGILVAGCDDLGRRDDPGFAIILAASRVRVPSRFGKDGNLAEELAGQAFPVRFGQFHPPAHDSNHRVRNVTLVAQPLPSRGVLDTLVRQPASSR